MQPGVSRSRPPDPAFEELAQDAAALRQDLNQKEYELYEKDKAQRILSAENGAALLSYSEQLEGDKVQWIKKLNSVLMEKDRVNKEKAELIAELHEERVRNEDLEYKLKYASKKKAGDRVVHSELKSEKDENGRLRDLVHRLEVERAELRAKMRDYEAASAAMSRENADLTVRLQQEMDRVFLVENDSKSLLEQIRALKLQITEFESEHATLLHERASMRESISQLESDKGEALSHMNDLGAKHENYVFAMNNEKENLHWIHRRHTRLLASRSIALELEKLTSKRVLGAFSYVQGFARFLDSKNKHVYKLFWTMQRYSNSAMKRGIDKWRNLLDWKGTERIERNFIKQHDRKTTLGRFFGDWRALFLYRTRVKERHGKALERLFRFYGDGMKFFLRRRFAIWRGKNSFQNSRSQVYQTLLVHGYTGKVRHSLSIWKEYMFSLRKEQAKEDIATEFSSLLLSQAVLSAWKTIAFRSKARGLITSVKSESADRLHNLSVLHNLQRYVSRKKAKTDALIRAVRRFSGHQLALGMTAWKKEVKEHKTLQRMALVLGRQHYKRYFTTFEKTFLAWKTHFLTQKYASAAERLTTEVPRRQDMEAQLHDFQVETRRNSQVKSVRAVMRWLGYEVGSYFSQWRGTVKHYKSTVPRMIQALDRWRGLQTHQAFSHWRHLLNQADLALVYDRNQQLITDNSALVEHVSNLEQVLQHREEQQLGMTQKRLKSAMVLLMKFGQKTAMRKWARTGLSEANQASGGMALEKTLRYRITKDGFQALQDYTRKERKSQNRKTRLRHYFLVKWRGAMAESFYAWVHMHTVLKRVKDAIKRLTTRRQQFYKQKGVNGWRDSVAAIHIATQRLHREKTLAEKETLEIHVSDISAQLQDQTHRKEALEKKLGKIAKTRLLNAINHCLNYSLFKGFNTWSRVSTLLRKRVGKSKLISFLYAKTRLRRSVRVWQTVVNKGKKEEYASQVILWQKTQKESVRAMKGTEERLEGVITEKDQEIRANEDIILTMNNRLQFLLDRTVRQQEEEYSMSKAGYLFKFWSNRCRLLKSSLTHLTNIAQRSVLKQTLWDLKSHQTTAIGEERFRNAVINWMQGHETRMLRSAVDNWTKNAHLAKAGKLLSLYTEENHRNVTLQANIRSLVSKASMKLISNVTRIFSLKVVSEWRKTTTKLRNIRLAGESFSTTSRQMRIQLALSGLKNRRVYRQSRRRTKGSAFAKFFGSLKEKTIFAFRRTARDNKTLRNLFGRLEKQFIREKTLFALGNLKEEAALAKANADHLTESRFRVLTRLLSSLQHWKEAKALRTWKQSHAYRNVSRNQYRKTLFRSLHRKLSSALVLWKEEMKFKGLENYYNNEGPVAVENTLLKDRLAIYGRLVQEEGLDPKFVERYILERESMAGALRRKGIARMIYAAGMNPKAAEDQSQVLPRALLRWKIWVVKRGKVRRFAHRMQAYRRHGDTMQAFFTWKRGLPLVRNTLANFTRTGLISLIAKLDRDVKTLEGMVESHNEKLKFMQAYSGLLEQHTRRGRNQSLSVMTHQIKNPMAQALSRWSAFVNISRATELQSQIIDLDDQYQVLISKYEQLETEYKNVFEENKELRQATLDGLEIADAIEALSREREKLSVDLADRAVTIKKLLEENGELAGRLRSAQKEAETLRVLTTPAEREVRFETLKRM